MRTLQPGFDGGKRIKIFFTKGSIDWGHFWYTSFWTFGFQTPPPPLRRPWGDPPCDGVAPEPKWSLPLRGGALVGAARARGGGAQLPGPTPWGSIGMAVRRRRCPPPPAPTKGTVVGNNEMCRWGNPIGPFLVHTLFWVPHPLPPPPPPSPIRRWPSRHPAPQRGGSWRDAMLCFDWGPLCGPALTRQLVTGDAAKPWPGRQQTGHLIWGGGGGAAAR